MNVMYEGCDIVANAWYKKSLRPHHVTEMNSSSKLRFVLLNDWGELNKERHVHATTFYKRILRGFACQILWYMNYRAQMKNTHRAMP